MRKTTMFFLTGLLLAATLAFAGNGDLIVDGNLGVGTASPRGRIDIGASVGAGKGFRSGDYLEINEREYYDNATSIGFNASIAADNGTYVPVYAPGSGMIMSMASGGQADLDFWGINWGGSSTPVDLGTFKHVMRLSTNGNVGIGTTNPGAKLSVSGVATGGAPFVGMQIFNTVPYFGGNGGGPARIEIGRGLLHGYIEAGSIVDNDSSVGYLAFGTRRPANNVQEALRIDSNGNVGIGTPNPAFKLDVQGTIGSNNAPVLTSDIKFKKNLLPINTPLDKVLSLTGLTYEWKTDEYKEKNFQEGRHYGVIAQEIEKVLPEVVNTAPDGSKAVAYTEIIPVLIEAIKQQQVQIDELKKKVADLQK